MEGGGGFGMCPTAISVTLAVAMTLTPLHVAAQLGREATITSLVEAGADVNARDENGNTPLFLAVQGRHLGVVSRLLRAGADPNIPARDGRTPLSESRIKRHEFSIYTWFVIWTTKAGDDDPLVRLLVESGAK